MYVIRDVIECGILMDLIVYRVEKEYDVLLGVQCGCRFVLVKNTGCFVD